MLSYAFVPGAANRETRYVPRLLSLDVALRGLYDAGVDASIQAVYFRSPSCSICDPAIAIGVYPITPNFLIHTSIRSIMLKTRESVSRI